jgi:hypothetical protein
MYVCHMIGRGIYRKFRPATSSSFLPSYAQGMDAVEQIQEDSERAIEPLIPAVTERELSEYQNKVAAAAGPGGKFNEKRRMRYLAERQKGTPHLTACRRADISPTTYDRYSTAVGQVWKDAVRYARDESMDPIRAVRRAKAMEGEPWAVRAEIGNGEDGRVHGGNIGTQVNVGAVVVGGQEGVTAALGGLLEKLRAREGAIETEAVES